MHPDSAHSQPAARSGPISRWLWLMAALVVAMLVVGGITRLTESGLSITQWRPVSGIVPPLSEAEWQAEFAHYRQIDQFAAIHSGMDLAQFKHIFYWEYGHRVLGRVVGLVAALGWGWFLVRRQIPRGYGLRLLAASKNVVLAAERLVVQEVTDQVEDRAVQHAEAHFQHLVADGLGQIAFPHSRRTDQKQLAPG